MKIEMTERELTTTSNNIKKQVARFVDNYIEQMDESENEEGVYLVEKADLLECILGMKIELQTIIQPKN